MTDEALQSAREWLARHGQAVRNAPYLYVCTSSTTAAESLAARFEEWRSRGEREGMERAAQIVEAERAKLGKRWSLDSAYLIQATCEIREAAPPSTLKEPPQQALSTARPFSGRKTTQPSAAPQDDGVDDSGASPQSETPRPDEYHCLPGKSNAQTAHGGSVDWEHVVEVRAAEQRVIDEAEYWRSRPPQSRNLPALRLEQAVDALRALRGKTA